MVLLFAHCMGMWGCMFNMGCYGMWLVKIQDEAHWAQKRKRLKWFDPLRPLVIDSIHKVGILADFGSTILLLRMIQLFALKCMFQV